MSDLVTAAKTLRALGDGDEGLKCVESDPPEIQRSALKKIRRAAGGRASGRRLHDGYIEKWNSAASRATLQRAHAPVLGGRDDSRG